MALALIVEDGTNVANANSFATLEQLRAFNLYRDVTLPEDDDAVIALSGQAMDYFATYEDKFAGSRTFGIMQSLCWPRAGVCVFGTPILSSYIPASIVAAQAYLVGIAQTIDLTGNADTRAVVKEVIGPLETDYSATQGASAGPLLPILTGMLKPFFKSGVGMLRSVRV